MINIHDPNEVRAAMLALVEAVRDAERRAKEAQARVAEMGECALQLLSIVEQRLRDASERVQAVEAKLEQERRAHDERFRQAEIRVAEAEERAAAAEDLLDDLRAILTRSDRLGTRNSIKGIEHALH